MGAGFVDALMDVIEQALGVKAFIELSVCLGPRIPECPSCGVRAIVKDGDWDCPECGDPVYAIPEPVTEIECGFCGSEKA